VSFCAEEAAGALVAVIVFVIWMPKTAEQETSSPESGGLFTADFVAKVGCTRSMPVSHAAEGDRL
jgi:hypothetical protein